MRSIDWHNTTKTFPGILSGVLEQLITEKMNENLSDIQQAYSFSFYQRYDTGVNNGPLTFQVTPEYYYILFGFRAFWPLNRDSSAINTVSFRAEIVSISRKLQEIAIPLNIESTPAQYQPMRVKVKENQPFFPDDKLMIYVSFNPLDVPDYVDIMTEGVRIPTNMKTEF